MEYVLRIPPEDPRHTPFAPGSARLAFGQRYAEKEWGLRRSMTLRRSIPPKAWKSSVLVPGRNEAAGVVRGVERIRVHPCQPWLSWGGGFLVGRGASASVRPRSGRRFARGEIGAEIA
jgi:hypothetical protein